MYDLGFIAYVFSGTFDHIRQTCSHIYVIHTYVCRKETFHSQRIRMYVHAYIVTCLVRVILGDLEELNGTTGCPN